MGYIPYNYVDILILHLGHELLPKIITVTYAPLNIFIIFT